MVVADLDFVRTIGAPDEADAPLVVDSDAVLSRPVASQAFQSVSGRAPQVLQNTRRVQEEELPVGLALDVGCQSGYPLPLEDPPRQGVPEAADHAGRLRHANSNVKRYYSSAGYQVLAAVRAQVGALIRRGTVWASHSVALGWTRRPGPGS